MNYKPLPHFVVPRWFIFVNWWMDLYEKLKGSKKDWTAHGYAQPWFILVDENDPELVAHEQEHGFQMKRDGWLKWHKKYAKDLKNPDIGYWKMQYEIDAREAAKNVTT